MPSLLSERALLVRPSISVWRGEITDRAAGTYAELLTTVRQIASFIADGDQFPTGVCECGCNQDEHEMSIDDAFETASAAISMCRDVLGTDGSDLAIVKPSDEAVISRGVLLHDPS